MIHKVPNTPRNIAWLDRQAEVEPDDEHEISQRDRHLQEQREEKIYDAILHNESPRAYAPDA